MPGNLYPTDAPAPDMSGYVKKSDIATTMPNPEATAAAPGSSKQVAASDHTHPRLSSAGNYVTGSNGKVTVAFTRTFTAAPVVVGTAVESADNGPVTFKVESWLDDVGQAWAAGKPYGGAVIYAYRSRSLPTINALSGLTIIGPLVTALNTVFAALSGYIPFAAAPNLSFGLLAIAPSS